jgi:hypothetical protein
MVFIGGVRRCCDRRLGALGPLGSHVSSLHRHSDIGYSTYPLTLTCGEIVFGNVPTHSRPTKEMWLCLILDIMKICMEFGPYGAFPSSDVPEMVDQQNSWNSLVIGTYLLYFE